MIANIKRILFILIFVAIIISPVMGVITTTYNSYVSGGVLYNSTKFTGTGTTTWEVPDGVTNIRYLVVGAGGGGGFYGGGGGGGGGVTYNTVYGVTPGHVWTVNIGPGGPGANSGNITGGNGTASIFTRAGTANFTALGGGGGGSFSAVGRAGLAGGNGGGAGSTHTSTTVSGGVYVNSTTDFLSTSDGSNGGQTNFTMNASPYPASGGGGATRVGIGAGCSASTACSVTTYAGPGANGRSDTLETGASIFYGGGGGGGAGGAGATGGTGGNGGGGAGGLGLTSSPIVGTNGLGGGGGGGNTTANGADGGSGVIIIRYEEPIYQVFMSITNASTTGVSNMDLQPSFFDSTVTNITNPIYNWHIIDMDGAGVWLFNITTTNTTTSQLFKLTEGNYQVNLSVYSAVNGIWYNATPYNGTTPRTIKVRPYRPVDFSAYVDPSDTTHIFLDAVQGPYKMTTVNITSKGWCIGSPGPSCSDHTSNFSFDTNLPSLTGTVIGFSGVMRNGSPFYVEKAADTFPTGASDMGSFALRSTVRYLNNDTSTTLGPFVQNYTQFITIPKDLGSWYVAATSEPAIYIQNVPATGLGLMYSGYDDPGTALDIAAADSAASNAVARGLYMDIYQIDATLVGQASTGGIVRAVDIAVKNGLWAISGGDDGKFYVFSKTTDFDWLSVYQGDSGEIINDVAITWRGDYAVAGRADGAVEYYSMNATSGSNAALSFMASVFISKGGSAYSNIDVNVTTGDTAADALVGLLSEGKTDSAGKYVFAATEGKYYNINVNNGEYNYMYQASATYSTISFDIPEAMLTRPYDYGTNYNDSTRVITTTYTDVNNAAVIINITDVTTNQLMKSTTYPSSTSITNTYTVASANATHQFKVDIAFTRTTGHQYKDTIYVSNSTLNWPGTGGVVPTQWVLFKYAVYSVFLMLVALGIGATSTKWGVILLPALSVLGIIIGFLPFNLYTGGILVICFIALTEVMRRRQD